MKLSVIIPAKDEEKSIENVITQLVSIFRSEDIDFEIIVVNDNSSDSTIQIMEKMAAEDNRIVVVNRDLPAGFGRAVRDGLSKMTGDAATIFMADLSDDPKDLILYYRKLQEGHDCVFGSRFIKGSSVDGYPQVKLLTNRFGNFLIQLLFFTKSNDITNAFKAYRKEVIDAVLPLEADHFNITVEIPLKAIVRGFSYVIVPISWHGRKQGISKHKLKELLKVYLYSIFQIFWERISLRNKNSKLLLKANCKEAGKL